MSNTDIESDFTTEIPESYQEYIETIYRLMLKSSISEENEVSNINIANYLNIKPSSVTNMLRKLDDEGLIRWKPRKAIKLTNRGKEIGRNIITNHLLIEIFLKYILHLKEQDKIHKYACEMEHHFDKTMVKAFKIFVGKKVIKIIDDHLEGEKDPDNFITDHNEELLKLLSPQNIINTYTDYIIEKLPELKTDLEGIKKDFLDEF